MSRRTFLHEGLTVLVGWDGLLASFFAMVDGEADNAALEVKVKMFRGMGYGASIGEGFTEIEVIVSALAIAGITVPDEIIVDLHNDQAASRRPKISPAVQALINQIERRRPSN